MKTKFLILFILLVGCTTKNPKKNTEFQKQEIVLQKPEADNPYLKKFTGGYTVEIKGISGYGTDEDAEVYVLGANGQAKWMMVKKTRNGGAVVQSEQTGTWTATETKISITAGDKSDPSTEDFVLLNGTFINTQTDMDVPLSKRHYRYLKPVVK